MSINIVNLFNMDSTHDGIYLKGNEKNKTVKCASKLFFFIWTRLTIEFI